MTGNQWKLLAPALLILSLVACGKSAKRISEGNCTSWIQKGQPFEFKQEGEDGGLDHYLGNSRFCVDENGAIVGYEFRPEIKGQIVPNDVVVKKRKKRWSYE